MTQEYVTRYLGYAENVISAVDNGAYRPNLFKKLQHVINVGVDVWDYSPVSQRKIYRLFGGK